jgi:hypothetical protein
VGDGNKPIPPWLVDSREVRIEALPNAGAQNEPSVITNDGPSWVWIGFIAFLLGLGISLSVEPGWGSTPGASSETVTWFLPVSAVVGPGFITFVVALALPVFGVSLWFGFTGGTSQGFGSSSRLLAGQAA